MLRRLNYSCGPCNNNYGFMHAREYDYLHGYFASFWIYMHSIIVYTKGVFGFLKGMCMGIDMGMGF